MLSFLDELNKINKNSDIALTIQLTGKLIEQFHETQSVEINRLKQEIRRQKSEGKTRKLSCATN